MDFDGKQLVSTDLFTGFFEDELKKVVESFNGFTQDFEDDEKIFDRGRRINQFGIVLKGSIVLKQIQINGTEVILNIFNQYKVFGTVICFLEEKNENLEYVSRGKTKILFLDMSEKTKDSIYRCKIFENLARILAQITYQFYKRTKIISQPTLREKILMFFNIFYSENHKNPFELPLTRSELANYINAERSALCRELSRMQKDGLILLEGRNVTLLEGNTLMC